MLVKKKDFWKFTSLIKFMVYLKDKSYSNGINYCFSLKVINVILFILVFEIKKFFVQKNKMFWLCIKIHTASLLWNMGINIVYCLFVVRNLRQTLLHSDVLKSLCFQFWKMKDKSCFTFILLSFFKKNE